MDEEVYAVATSSPEARDDDAVRVASDRHWSGDSHLHGISVVWLRALVSVLMSGGR